MQTATADPLVGRVLEGRYRIQARIARGGMSTVYSAVDKRLDRLVAVKVMSSGLSSDATFADRFAREARAAAKLAHINTVAVYDQGEDSGHVFLVMELVTGRTLRDLIRERGRLTPAESVSIMEQVLAALAVAHRAGLVHRDIKPENILLSDDGVVKVADFGLARAVESDAAATHTGMMMGTVAYCSPEQVSRGSADQRSDVYSAGVVLFELLTGQAPYVGDSAMAVAYQHVHSRVPAPSSRVPGIREELDDLVVRVTDSDPAGRPLDAGAFLAELADVRADLDLPVVPVPARPRPNGRAAETTAAITPNVRTTQPLSGTGFAHDTALDLAAPYLPGPAGSPRHAPAGPPVAGRGAGRPPGTAQQARLAHRRKRRRSALAIVIVLLLLGAAAGVGGWWLVAGRYTRVPVVAGEPRATAVSALDRAGFSKITVSQVNDDSVPAGSVVGTKPAGNSRVQRHGAVTLLVSIGPKVYAIPDVQGRSEKDARAVLNNLPLEVSSTQRASASVPAGTVIGTEPRAGSRVHSGDRVTLLVSSGPPIATIPDVRNTSQEDATATLTGQGFKVDVTTKSDDTVAQGLVISQDPGPNSQLAEGRTVTLTVSKGPDLVTVPDVTGNSTADARATLEGLGLKVRERKALGGPLDEVVSTNPPAGSQVHKGDTVTLFII